MGVDQIEVEALKLPANERARLAERLLMSLGDDPEIEQAWTEEIIRRCKEIDSGKADLFPAAEVFVELRSRLP